MDEEKKEKSAEENSADIIFTREKSLFSKDSEFLPEVKEEFSLREFEALREAQIKAQRRAMKEERKKNRKYPDRLGFMLGLVVIIFAVIGIVLTVWNSVRYITSTMDNGTEYSEYNEYLTPVVAVDPDPFDDISAANKEQLLNAAIWSILSDETTPDTYKYSGGYMLIPASDVASAFTAIFGPEAAVSLTHMTVQGYNSVFEYNVTDDVYKIPVTTISPIYTPQVTDVSKSGTSLVVTVNLLASESWVKDKEGNFVAPEPDKVVKVTLRELQGSYFINAVQTVSSTVPETITFEATTKEWSSDIYQEHTTNQKAEKTTLGGKVQ